MKKNTVKSSLQIGISLFVVAVFLAACSGGSTEPTIAPGTDEVQADEHLEAEEHEDEHTEGEEHEDESAEGEAHEDEHAEGEENEDEHAEDEGETHAPEDHVAGHDDIPEEAAAVPNPIDPTDDSIQKGAELYAVNCALCHGETGEGDGPAAEGLEQPPSNLHDEHVQENTDGVLFYIISHGKPETAMPPWEDALNVEERWQVVNFMRTFEEIE